MKQNNDMQNTQISNSKYCSVCYVTSAGRMLYLSCKHALCPSCLKTAATITSSKGSEKNHVCCPSCGAKTTLDMLDAALLRIEKTSNENSSNYSSISGNAIDENSSPLKKESSSNSKLQVVGNQKKKNIAGFSSSVTVLPPVEGNSFQMMFPSFRDFPTEESGRKVSEKKIKKSKKTDCMNQIDFNTANSLELVSPNLNMCSEKKKKNIKESIPDRF